MEDLFNEFFNEFNGESVEVVDPSNYAQCFDLALKWCMWLGLPIDTFAGLMYAKDILSPSTKIAADNFDYILNTPDAFIQTGDLVIFGTGVGKAGHVSIAHKNIDQNTFESFDENWPVGSFCKLVTHSYKDVIGWLRFKKPITNSQPTMNEQDKKDIESMNKLRAYNGVWYEAQNIINDFNQLKADRKRDSEEATKAYIALEQLYKDALKSIPTAQTVTKPQVAEEPVVCQPKIYTNSFASMLIDLADIVERRFKK